MTPDRKCLFAAVTGFALLMPGIAWPKGTCAGLTGPAADALQDHARSQGIGDAGACDFYGDYTGDGADDSFAVFYTETGGNSFTVEGHVFRNQGGSYVPEGNIELQGLDPREVSFSLHQVEVTMTVPRPGDPRCCPSGSERFVFAMD